MIDPSGILASAFRVEMYLLARVADPSAPDDRLSTVELAVRAWRQEVIADLGGAEAVPATRAALLDAAIGTKVNLDTLGRSRGSGNA